MKKIQNSEDFHKLKDKCLSNKLLNPLSLFLALFAIKQPKKTTSFKSTKSQTSEIGKSMLKKKKVRRNQCTKL